jgi:hypothetical protein
VDLTMTWMTATFEPDTYPTLTPHAAWTAGYYDATCGKPADLACEEAEAYLDGYLTGLADPSGR